MSRRRLARAADAFLDDRGARPPRLACVLCGREYPLGPSEACWRCRRELLAPSPLDALLEALGFTHREFAELSGIPLRTVRRAAAGERVAARSAAALATATGLPASTFRTEE